MHTPFSEKILSRNLNKSQKLLQFLYKYPYWRICLNRHVNFADELRVPEFFKDDQF